MVPVKQIYLAAIRPEFVEALFTRIKRHEFRRSRWSIRRGDQVLVYESRRRRSIVGCFTAGGVFYGQALELAALVVDPTQRRAVQHYLAGAERATAVEATEMVVFPKVVPLGSIGVSRPPQSYLRVRQEQLNGVLWDN